MGENRKEEEDKRSENQARAQLAGIVELVGLLERAEEADDPLARYEYDGDDYTYEGLEEALYQDPLSVEVRDGWRPAGERKVPEDGPEEFRILLCWGGPAVRIWGEFGLGGSIERIEIQHQDWGTPWTRLHDTTDEEDECLKNYAGRLLCL
jgi:hypothetical protein